jgi:hypothetical protein
MRFDHDADDRAGATRYLHERAYQTLIDGFHPERDEVEVLATDGVEWGVRARARDHSGAPYQSVYIYAAARGRGFSARAFAGGPPVVTTPGCRLEAFLSAKRIPHVVAARITETAEYLAIERAYGTRTAQRSGVPLMRHIDEGLAVLQRIDAPDEAMRAFCLHPLLQEDPAYAANLAWVTALTEPHVLALALAYRRVANATLSTRPIASAADIPLSGMVEVDQMLVADKVQNRKDFLLHHRGHHPRSEVLDRYFQMWLERLGVAETRFAELFEDLQVTAAPKRLASLGV